MPKWIFIEQIEEYWFWKYEDTDGQFVYNVTMNHKPPTTNGGYYGYGYLLKVKGLLKGSTLTSIFAELK